jgi:PKD repeat protein
MRKIAISIVCMMLLGTFFVVTPDTVCTPLPDYTYTVDEDGNATITNYTGAGGAITIPSTLDGHPTVTIGYSAFNNVNGHSITSVIIPDSVTTIKNLAFYGCALLESVTIGRNVTDIGQFVFQYCSNLISITLLMHDPPAVCDCWINNTPNALKGHAYSNSHFPAPGEIWTEGKLTMGPYITLPLTAEFSYSPSSPTDVDVIQFTDASTKSNATISSWSWDFGDEGTSTLQNPTHDYADDGTYTVILTVTDDDGLSDSISKDVVVRNVPPTADFTYSPSSPTKSDIIHFADTSTDPDGTITLWSWEFGDGATSSIQNPTHQYTDDGTYLVNLRIADDNWASNSGSKDIVVSNVLGVSNVPPTADFTYSPSSPTDLDVIHFTDASTDPDGTIMSWSWNFGDGINSTSKNPQHSYTTPGQYTVGLEVVDNDGAKKSTSKIITVILNDQSSINNPPNPPLKPLGQTSLERGINYTFKSSAIDPDDDPVQLRCDWGDGSVSNWSEFVDSNTTVSWSHSWSSPSMYSIRVIARDNNGLNSSWSTPLTMTVSEPGTSNETPSFELIIVIGAIALVLLLKRKRIINN